MGRTLDSILRAVGFLKALAGLPGPCGSCTMWKSAGRGRCRASAADQGGFAKGVGVRTGEVGVQVGRPLRGEPWGFHNKGVRVVGKGRVGRRHLVTPVPGLANGWPWRDGGAAQGHGRSGKPLRKAREFAGSAAFGSLWASNGLPKAARLIRGGTRAPRKQMFL